jgi:Undecaprenyl-phosphate glucose phosphotransferase
MIAQDGATAARAFPVPAWPESSARAPQARSPATVGNSPGPLVSSGSPRHQGMAAPPGRASQISPRVFAGLIRIAEFSLLAALGFLIAYAYVAEFFRQYAAALSLTSLAAVTLFQALGLYSIPSLASLHRQLPRLISGWMATLALLLCAVFFVKAGAEFSRAWLALWCMTGIVCLLAFRASVAAIARHRLGAGSLTRRAVVYGAGQSCEGLLSALESGPDSDIKICGVFDDRSDDRSGQGVAGYPKLGDLAALLRYCRSMHIDLLIVALPLSAERRVLDIIKQLWVLPVDIRLAAQTSELRFRPRAYSFIGSVPLLDIIDKPITDWDVVIKRVFDLAGAALALVTLAPVMALVALAIKLDSRGPVLFRQKRYGFNNELIEVLKFRSMYADQADAGARQLVSKGDARVTRVGRFIRKTSLDELPQLCNVLRGELSLVGPRPHALQAKAADALYHDVVDGYFARHKVKPGITGWAQVSGWRGETDTPEKIQKRVEHDLYYIDNWSVLFDLYILLRTPLALLSTNNAY